MLSSTSSVIGLFLAAVEFVEGAVGFLLLEGGDLGRGDVNLHEWCIVEVVLGDCSSLEKALAVGITHLVEVGIVAEEHLVDGVIIFLSVVVFIGVEGAYGIFDVSGMNGSRGDG